MSGATWRQLGVVMAAAALIAAVAYWAYHSQPPRRPGEPGPVAGLDWLPRESGWVAGADLTALRQYPWLLEVLADASAGVDEEADYQAFVGATGFDYTRDLDRAWLGFFGPRDRPYLVGVAEGRFARETILAFAQSQKATRASHRGVTIHEIREESRAKQPARSFSFAFLDPTHLAFGSDARRVAQIVDCWFRQAPAVSSEASRRAHLEGLAVGRQIWIAGDLSRWSPAALQKQPDISSKLLTLSAGLRATRAGLELDAAARCREPGEAQRLRDNLRLLLLAGQVALAGERDAPASALRVVIRDLSLSAQHHTLEARLTISPETLKALLAPSPATAETR